MAAVTAAVVGAGVAAYGAKKQRDAASKGYDLQRRNLGKSETTANAQLAALFGTPGSTRTTSPRLQFGELGDGKYVGGIGGFGGGTQVTTPGTQGSVGTAFGNAGDMLRQYTSSASDLFRQGYSGAGNIATQGTQQAMNYLSPYADQGGQAFNMYNQALQGGQGAQDAFSAFQQSTGYNFLQDEMARATQRQFGAQGKTGSGGVLAALQERSSGIAAQSFNDYMSQLMGSAQMGQQAATQQAGMQQGLSSYLAGLQTEQANNLAGLQSNLGAGLANLQTGQATMEADFRKSLMMGQYGISTQAMANTVPATAFKGESNAALYDAIGGTIGAMGGYGGGGGSIANSGGSFGAGSGGFNLSKFGMGGS